MSEWQTVKLGEIADVFDGPHATPKKTTHGPWFLSISSLSNGRLDLSQSAHLSEEDYVIWTRRVTPREGDVLFSYETRLGEAAMMPAGLRACLGRRMGLLRPKIDRVNPRFLLYTYLSPVFQQQIRERTVHGATVDRIPISEMPSWEVRLPDGQTQERIASVLGPLDDKIVLNEQIAATARALDEALYKSHLQVRSFERTLGEITTLVARGIAPRYSEEESDLLVVNQRCIRDGRVLLGSARRTTRDKLRPDKLLRRHDVVVNSTGTGTLGRVAIWNSDQECTVDTHVTIVRFDPSKIDPLCAAYGMLKSQPYIEGLGEGSTGQTELSRSKLANFQIRLPAAEKMRSLQPALEALENISEHALGQAGYLQKLRDTLLPGLMSGQIRVRDAEKTVEALA